MKKFLTLILVFTFFLSCQKKEVNFSDEMLEKLVVLNENDNLPPLNSFFDLYVITDNNEIMKTDNYSLYKFYSHHYHEIFKNEKFFLDGILNNDFKLQKKFFENTFYLASFKLNSKIEKDYLNLGFEKFLKKYSEKTSSNRTKLKKSIIKEGEYQTIVYLLYKNKYDLSIDCYVGNDYIERREEYFESSK